LCERVGKKAATRTQQKVYGNGKNVRVYVEEEVPEVEQKTSGVAKSDDEEEAEELFKGSHNCVFSH